MQIKLPLSKDPIISLLPRYAHPLSILLVEGSKNLPYLLNDFSRLVYDCEFGTLRNPKYDWMYIGCGALTYECGVFPPSILKESAVITNFITAMIENGRYCIVDVDEFFCSFSSQYQSQHKVSGVLVSGFDTDSKTLFLSNFSEKEGYRDYEVCVDEFLQAITCPHLRLVVHCFKPRKCLQPPIFDKTALFNIVEQYGRPDLLPNEQARYQYDSAALQMVIARIQSGGVQPEWLKSAALSLYEHKTIMLYRLLWLRDHRAIDNSWYSIYCTIHLIAGEIYSLSIRYEQELQTLFSPLETCLQCSNEERRAELLANISSKIFLLSEKEDSFIKILKQ